MLQIQSGYNDFAIYSIDTIRRFKLSEIPQDATINIFEIVQFDTERDIVFNLKKYDETSWRAQTIIGSDKNESKDIFVDDIVAENEDVIDYKKSLYRYSIIVSFQNILTINDVVNRCIEISDKVEALCDKSFQSLIDEKSTNKIISMLPVYQRAVNKLILEVKNFQDEFDPQKYKILNVSGRVKDIRSIKEKSFRKNFAIENALKSIEDFAGIRIVCQYIEDVYDILKYFESHPQYQVCNLDNKILNPTDEGYRAIHFICLTDIYYQTELHRDIKVECQVRTSYQDSWATKTHALTYKNTHIPENILQQMKILSDLLHTADQTSSILKEEIEKHNISLKPTARTRAVLRKHPTAAA